MRYIEITSGVRIPISSEEQDIIDKIDSKAILKSSLDEREREVARKMVSRGILKRHKDSDNNTILSVNKYKLYRN